MLKIALRADAMTFANSWRRLSRDTGQFVFVSIAYLMLLFILTIAIIGIVQRFEPALIAHFDQLTGVFPQLAGLTAYFLAGPRMERTLNWCVRGWLGAFSWTRRDMLSYVLLRTAVMTCVLFVCVGVFWALVLSTIDRPLWPYLWTGLLEILASLIYAVIIALSVSRINIENTGASDRLGRIAALSLGLTLLGSAVYVGTASIFFVIGKNAGSFRLVATFLLPIAVSGVMYTALRWSFLNASTKSIRASINESSVFIPTTSRKSRIKVVESLDGLRVRHLTRFALNSRRTSRLSVKHVVSFRLIIALLFLVLVSMSQLDLGASILIMGVGGGLAAVWVATACVHSIDQIYRFVRPFPVDFPTIMWRLGRLPSLVILGVASVAVALSASTGLATAAGVGGLVICIGFAMNIFRTLLLLTYPNDQVMAEILFVALTTVVTTILLTTAILAPIFLAMVYWRYWRKARKVWNGEYH